MCLAIPHKVLEVKANSWAEIKGAASDQWHRLYLQLPDRGFCLLSLGLGLRDTEPKGSAESGEVYQISSRASQSDAIAVTVQRGGETQ